jgi:hypothetical protein
MDLYIFLKIQVIERKKESGSPAWQRILSIKIIKDTARIFLFEPIPASQDLFLRY